MEQQNIELLINIYNSIISSYKNSNDINKKNIRNKINIKIHENQSDQEFLMSIIKKFDRL